MEEVFPSFFASLDCQRPRTRATLQAMTALLAGCSIILDRVHRRHLLRMVEGTSMGASGEAGRREGRDSERQPSINPLCQGDGTGTGGKSWHICSSGSASNSSSISDPNTTPNPIPSHSIPLEPGPAQPSLPPPLVLCALLSLLKDKSLNDGLWRV